MDPSRQKDVFGRFATGVTILGLRGPEGTWGMTANAVTSLSLDPALVVVCVARDNETHPRMRPANAFGLTILRADQADLSNRFAFVGPRDFSGLALRPTSTDSPVLASCLAWVDCRLHAVHDGGDHELFVGRIVDCGVEEGDPLLYYRGRYDTLGGAPPS